MQYEDLIIEATNADLVCTPEQRRLGRFKVRVLSSPAGEMKPEEAVPVEYNDEQLHDSLPALETRQLDRAGLIELGRTLALLLLPPDRHDSATLSVRELLAVSLAQLGPDRGLRLRLRLPPSLAALPWEYLYVDRAGGGDGLDGFLALDPRVAIVRHEVLSAPTPPPLVKGDVKVVAVLASAVGSQELDLANERAALEQAFGEQGVALVLLENPTLDEVQGAIPGAGVFHFAGHGQLTRRMGDHTGTYSGTGELALADQWVEAEQLAVNLRGNGVRLAVLSGCETGRHDGAHVWDGIAPALVKAEIPAVVAHQLSIKDECAISFSRQLYRALVGGLSIDRAVSAGRIAAYNARPHGREWGVPVLYLRSRHGHLFAGAANADERRRARADAEVSINLRMKEVAAGGEVLGAEVNEMIAGKLTVSLSIGGVVYGQVVGATVDHLGGGKARVDQDIGTGTEGMGDSRAQVNVKQKVGQAKEGSSIKGVEVNIYSHFQAAPASLRRSFDTLIQDKLRGFVGRQFVLEAIDDFLNRHESGYLIIRGVPGIGKSALMAKLINDRGYVHHFNIASQNIRSTRIFLENACAQLIARYELSHGEIPPRAFEDSGFLAQCLEEAAADSQNHPIVLAIDALDEADRLGLAAAVNTLYLPSSLPRGVYAVVTSRPLDDLRLAVAQQQVLDLEADSKGNLQDITTYIERYVIREGMPERLAAWDVSEEQFVAALRSKSQGNFMYLYYVLPAIAAGRFVKGTLDELPEGLMAYYRRHWRQMREGNEKRFDAVYEPIVCILGVAQEPVTVQQIANWTSLEQGQVKESLRLWREFLEEEQVDGERSYRIYHASFQDFLKEQVDLVKYDGLIADYYLALAGLV